MRIEIVSASAGTGKTYRLAEILSDEIAKGVPPEAVLATTFTNKAAAELRERVRRRLVDEGRVEEARRLGAARIGTVNSVCARLVTDYAFELGLPPDLAVLDEEGSDRALRAAISRSLGGDEAEEFADVESRMRDFHWAVAVRRIVNLARDRRLDPERFTEYAQESVAAIRSLLGEPVADPAALENALLEALEAFERGYDPRVDDRKKTATEFADRIRPALGRLRHRQALSWADWLNLSNLGVAKESQRLAKPIIEAAAAHDGHPLLREDLEKAIRSSFAVAARVLRTYELHKRERGVLDFVDQETYALDLLSIPHVATELSESIQLVLVDEFQDTSPIQLAIFLRLAEIARRSYWVGDQKQSIYAFRGADPELMESALRAIREAGGNVGPPQKLSRRSRPELVHLTSDVFVPSFARHGIEERFVRIAPADEQEPPDLGPIVERWSLEVPKGGRNEEKAAALADAVRQFLADPTSTVRDRATGTPRPATASDLAILCRTHGSAAQVAEALEALGIPAVVPRAGLLDRVEARLALAGVRLYVDPSDAHAAADVARILEGAQAEDAWLDRLLEAPRAARFFETDSVRRVLAAREASPHAGVHATLDAVYEALDLRERCLEWGDSDQRLANLDALRSHAHAYVELAIVSGAAATPAGLISYLEGLTEKRKTNRREDSQAVLAGADAVVISTWHAAKGLEWPVVALYDLHKDPSHESLGVRPARDETPFRFDDPLAGNRIRFWPTPYREMHRRSRFHERLGDRPEYEADERAAEREHLRLLYVGWTRARDRLVLAEAPGQLERGILSLLQDDTGFLLSEPSSGTRRVSWARRRVPVAKRSATRQTPVQPAPSPGSHAIAPGSRAHPPARLVASESQATGQVIEVIRLGDPLALGPGAPPDPRALGEAVHAFLGADVGLSLDARHQLALDSLSRWGVAPALLPEQLVEASDRLHSWIEANYPGARVLRECPLHHRLTSGTVVRGTADLVIESEDGSVLIDHKAIAADTERSIEAARGYAGQLANYGTAYAAATSKPLTAAFIHLPIAGVVCGLQRR